MAYSIANYKMPISRVHDSIEWDFILCNFWPTESAPSSRVHAQFDASRRGKKRLHSSRGEKEGTHRSGEEKECPLLIGVTPNLSHEREGTRREIGQMQCMGWETIKTTPPPPPPNALDRFVLRRAPRARQLPQRPRDDSLLNNKGTPF